MPEPCLDNNIGLSVESWQWTIPVLDVERTAFFTTACFTPFPGQDRARDGGNGMAAWSQPLISHGYFTLTKLSQSRWTHDRVRHMWMNASKGLYSTVRRNPVILQWQDCITHTCPSTRSHGPASKSWLQPPVRMALLRYLQYIKYNGYYRFMSSPGILRYSRRCCSSVTPKKVRLC